MPLYSSCFQCGYGLGRRHQFPGHFRLSPATCFFVHVFSPLADRYIPPFLSNRMAGSLFSHLWSPGQSCSVIAPTARGHSSATLIYIYWFSPSTLFKGFAGENCLLALVTGVVSAYSFVLFSLSGCDFIGNGTGK